MGVRAEESFKRKQRGRVSIFTKGRKETHYHPIFWWSSREIWEYIRKYNLKYPCLYDEGHARIGCIICPFLSGAQLKRAQERWPKYWQTMRKYLKINWDKNKDKLIEMNFTEDEFVNHWPVWKSRNERKFKGLNIENFISKKEK
jgi:phosphoadenosine phosphosulfate reductase